MRQIATLTTLLFLTTPALATDYVCSNGGLEREIRVQYEVTGQAVPCSVVYTKSADDIQYPWTAQSQAGYCEEKADYLAERLKGFGWQCEAQGE